MGLFTGTFSSSGSASQFDANFSWSASGSLTVDIEFNVPNSNTYDWKVISVDAELTASGSIDSIGNPTRYANFSSLSSIVDFNDGDNAYFENGFGAYIGGKDGDKDNTFIHFLHGVWNSEHTAVTGELYITVFDFVFFEAVQVLNRAAGGV